MDFDSLNICDDAIAIIDPIKKSIIFCNTTFREWFPSAETHESIPKTILEHELYGSEKIISLQIKSKTGFPFAVEFRFQEKQDQFFLVGKNVTKVIEKQMMLDNFSKMIEINNQKLKREKRRIHDLFNNLPLAVFTINSDLKIEPLVSKNSEEIFHQSIAGKKVEDIFSEGFESLDKKSAFTSSLIFSFEQDSFQWSLNQANLPKRLIFSSEGKDTVILRPSYSPLYDEDDLVSKILVIVEDISQIEAIEKKYLQEKRDASVRSEIILQIVNCGISESREHLGALKTYWEKLPSTADEVMNMDIAVTFRSLHTIKGNARSYNFSQISQLSHIAEEGLSQIRQSQKSDPTMERNFLSAIDNLLQSLKNYGSIVSSLQGENKSTEKKIVCTSLIANINKEAEALISGSHADFGPLLNEIKKLQHIESSRLKQSIESTSDYLREKLNKKFKIDFQIEIGFLPPDIFGVLKDCANHLVRNALDHGIEPPPERERRGKSQTGVVEISIRETDDNIIFEIQDDGAGIEANLIAKKAENLGLRTRKELSKLTNQEKLDLIFLPAVSTVNVVTDISGRGVGMDFVRESIHAQSGTVKINSKFGEGCEIMISLPKAGLKDFSTLKESA